MKMLFSDLQIFMEVANFLLFDTITCSYNLSSCKN